MNNTVWKVKHVTIDGVLFRTQQSQQRKGSITDNSCIVGYVNVQRNNRVVKEKCYGVIRRMYLHFMYPPPSKSTYKLTTAKLKDIQVPWIVCAWCDWYETLGQDPITGLTRIRPNPFWDHCPLHDMKNCHPSNVVFWPEDPFNLDDFDKAGAPKDPAVNNFKGNGNFLVITHSDDI
jgi:hypothetical protein